MSVPAIALEQMQLEGTLHEAPNMQKQFDEQAIQKEAEYQKARARAQLKVPTHKLVEGTEGREPERVKLLASERESQLLEACETEWNQWQDSKIQADYIRQVIKVGLAELSSKQSRLRAAVETSVAHGRIGAA